MAKHYSFLTWLVTKYTDVREHKSLLIFGRLLDDPYLFHLNERSVPLAFAIGLFFAWVPFPTQMIMSAAAAIIFRANVPISVLLVWITNPVTIPPMFYSAYVLGNQVATFMDQALNIQLSLEWLTVVLESIGLKWLAEMLVELGLPLLLGCAVLAVVSSILGYITMRIYWNKRLARLMHLKIERNQRYRQRHLDRVKKEPRGHHHKKH